MTKAILDRARRMIERVSPARLCGACVTERLADADGSLVIIALNELAVARGFDWAQDACGLCGERRQVIGKRAGGM